MEVESKVCTVKVDLRCDECGGRMERFGPAPLSNPPQYKYECEKCDAQTTSTQLYPHVKYVNREE